MRLTPKRIANQVDFIFLNVIKSSGWSALGSVSTGPVCPTQVSFSSQNKGHKKEGLNEMLGTKSKRNPTLTSYNLTAKKILHLHGESMLASKS